MIIRARSLIKSLWKNGGGTTTEITRVGLDDYEWRASFADVTADGRFSEFPGYDRALLIWQGDGLYLDGDRLPPLTPTYFKGTAREAILVNGPIRDFGVIFKRGKYACTFDVIDKPSITGTLLFVINGEIKIGGEVLGPEDSFLARADGSVEIESMLPGALAIRATISARSSSDPSSV